MFRRAKPTGEGPLAHQLLCRNAIRDRIPALMCFDSLLRNILFWGLFNKTYGSIVSCVLCRKNHSSNIHIFFNKMLYVIPYGIFGGLWFILFSICFFHLSPPVLKLHLGPFSVITFIFIKANLPYDGLWKTVMQIREGGWVFCFKHASNTHKLGSVTPRRGMLRLGRQGYG